MKTTKMFLLAIVSLVLLPRGVDSQQKGTASAEVHPALKIEYCQKSGCSDEQSSIVLDSNWRWLHNIDGYTNCYDGTQWNANYCSDPVACAKNCALEGADYKGVYGINAHDTTTELQFKVGSNVGSRVYLMEGDKYKQFKLKNREFTFDVDVSQLPCGLNGAVYFVEMPDDGGSGAFPTNTAGAAYGTGYCDAQCPKDIKFINGEANILDGTDFSKGGHYGACCAEMDIWEANSISSAYTSHVCDAAGGYRCEGNSCDQTGVCDKSGCDSNSFRAGNPSFYGPGSSFKVDTTQPFKVVTQFITEDGSDSSPLKEIKRFFVQNGTIIPNPDLQFDAPKGLNSLSDEYCAAQYKVFNETDVGAAKGGIKAMGEALDRGMTLVLSLWDDTSVYMLWLDSNYPLEIPSTNPGVPRGTCSVDSGRPAELESQVPNATVKYSNIRYGTIGTTFRGH